MKILHFIFSLLPHNLRMKFLAALWTISPNLTMPEVDAKLSVLGALFIPDMKKDETVDQYLHRLHLGLLFNFFGKSLSKIKNRLTHFLSKFIPNAKSEVSSLIDVIEPGEQMHESGSPLESVQANIENLDHGWINADMPLLMKVLRYLRNKYQQYYMILESRYFSGAGYFPVYLICRFPSMSWLFGRCYQAPMSSEELASLNNDDLERCWFEAMAIARMAPSGLSSKEAKALLYLMSPRSVYSATNSGMSGRFSSVSAVSFQMLMQLMIKKGLLLDETGLPAFLLEIYKVVKTEGFFNRIKEVYRVSDTTKDTADWYAPTGPWEFISDLYKTGVDFGDMVNLFTKMTDLMKEAMNKNDYINYTLDGQLAYFRELPSIYHCPDSAVKILWDLSNLDNVTDPSLKDELIRNSEVLLHKDDVPALKDEPGKLSELSVADISALDDKRLNQAYTLIDNYLDRVLERPDVQEKIAKLTNLKPEEIAEQGSFSFAKAFSKVKALADNPMVKTALTVMPYGSLVSGAIKAVDKNKSMLNVADALVASKAAKTTKTIKTKRQSKKVAESAQTDSPIAAETSIDEERSDNSIDVEAEAVNNDDTNESVVDELVDNI